MITIRLLGRFGLGLHADTDNVLECTQQILKVRENEQIFFDFSDVQFLYPSGIAILITLGNYMMLKKNCKITQNYPKNPEVKNFLSESGFAKMVGVTTPLDITIPPHNGSYIYNVKQFFYVDDFEIEKLLDVVEKELALSSQVRRHVHENLAELILNAYQHSKSGVGCYVMGQGYETSHRIRFCIGDAGIGIREHLGNRYKELLEKNSVFAIESALIEGVTGTFANQNSGVGLSNFKKFVNFCEGTFTILSGNGMYVEQIDSEKPNIVKRELDFEIPGTFVDVAINSWPGKKIFFKSEPIPTEYKLIK